MTNHIQRWMTLVIFVSLCTIARADAPLFSSTEILKLALDADFDSMCREREDDNCDYTPANLTYWRKPGASSVIPVEIKVRGGYRSYRKNCQVPPLFIRFDAEATRNTPFEGQTLLPLTTHCRDRVTKSLMVDLEEKIKPKEYEQYVLKEYLGYRLYSILTDVSLRVRLVAIEYTGPGRPGKKPKYAFLTEHFESLAARQQMKKLSRGSFDHQLIDYLAMDRLNLFHFMIGNTDYSVVRQRNTILLQGESGPQIPVPYDLDMSGLVDPAYGTPAPGLPINKNIERLYLGFCHPQLDWQRVYDLFAEKQPDMMAEIRNIPGLSRVKNWVVSDYLKQFYRILNSESDRQRMIEAQCQPWPPSPIDHTTPPEKRPASSRISG